MSRSLAGLALFGTLFAAPLLAQDSPFYPTKPGTAWTYGVNGTQIVLKVEKAEKIGEAQCFKIETIINGKSVASEHVAAAADGLFRHAVNGQKADAPLKFLQLPPKDGDKWTVDTKIQGKQVKGSFTTKKDKVKVPAGEYDAFVVDGTDFEIDGQKTTIKAWFAEKVGIVKLSFSLGTESTLELEKFEAAK